jgi:TetR/AcrR family transcriptional regulator, cholesterol catabolism regulator
MGRDSGKFHEFPGGLQQLGIDRRTSGRLELVERTFDIVVMSNRNPLPRDSEAKLYHILRHSAQIFAERGFEGASIRDISRATGVSLSGLYYYFESKQKLLYLIQQDVFASVLRRLQQRLSGIDAPEERLQIFIQNHVEYFLSHPAEMKVLSHEEEALEEPYRKDIAAIKRRYYSLAREIFDALASRRSAPPLNPRTAVLSLYGMMNWIYKWHNPKVDPSAEELAQTIATIFLHGVMDGGAGHGHGKDAHTDVQSKRNTEPLPLEEVGAAD